MAARSQVFSSLSAFKHWRAESLMTVTSLFTDMAGNAPFLSPSDGKKKFNQ